MVCWNYRATFIKRKRLCCTNFLVKFLIQSCTNEAQSPRVLVSTSSKKRDSWRIMILIWLCLSFQSMFPQHSYFWRFVLRGVRLLLGTPLNHASLTKEFSLPHFIHMIWACLLYWEGLCINLMFSVVDIGEAYQSKQDLYQELSSTK